MAIGANEYRIVWNKAGTKFSVRTGGTRRCPMAGCTGLRVFLRWSDGRITYPCTKGLVERSDGSYQEGE